MASKDTNVVQSVDRALTILESIAERRTGARVSDIATDVGLAVSTVHRLLTTMEQRHFVQQDPRTGGWMIGQRAHGVGESYSLHDSLVVPARPYLRSLRDQTRETANLGVIQSEEAVTISQVESREIMRAIAPPGGRVPVLNSGMGKAIVATWPDEAIASLIRRQGLRKMTSHSLGSEAEAFAEIEKIRQSGYAVDDEEYVIGMRCVAAVVMDHEGEAIAAVSVSGLAARVTHDCIPDIADAVVAAAKSLSAQIKDGEPVS
ncbi:IclR family transcriptional regulator [Cognatishimia activa]|uniref:IclR family transcriptional regulator n=1 Tax=Cognatishimia activa TaxID=1715691 RepID=UPI00071E1176|nr:IclR family transcriptional regulator [Cognatishimia activa]MEE2945989.1 IclR family transcriptional regulator [Pseudomonadota bacterium]